MLLQLSSNKQNILNVLNKKCEVLLADELLKKCRSGLKEVHFIFVGSCKLFDQSGTRAILAIFCNNILHSMSPNLPTIKQHQL
jgi:hypothetical protein